MSWWMTTQSYFSGENPSQYFQCSHFELVRLLRSVPTWLPASSVESEKKIELEWASISTASPLCKHPLKTLIFSGVPLPSIVHAVLQSFLYSIQRTKLQALLGWGKGSHSAHRGPGNDSFINRLSTKSYYYKPKYPTSNYGGEWCCQFWSLWGDSAMTIELVFTTAWFSALPGQEQCFSDLLVICRFPSPWKCLLEYPQTH